MAGIVAAIQPQIEQQVGDGLHQRVQLITLPPQRLFGLAMTLHLQKKQADQQGCRRVEQQHRQ